MRRVARAARRARVDVPCASETGTSSRVRPARDVVLGPLVLIGARTWATSAPDAFGRHGFKIPVTLPRGVEATLSVPNAMRGRVGLVYTRKTQERAWGTGVRGADTSVRFTACATRTRPGRSGWPGGLVVDRPRCVTLAVRIAGRPLVRRRVPLGRRC